MRCLTDLDYSNSKQKRRDRRGRTRERCKNYSVELRARIRNLRRVAGFHYRVAVVAGFHYPFQYESPAGKPRGNNSDLTSNHA